ncbi:ABC transporter substrate-binding protein [Wolbachia pipientis]|uniref:High-affinity zinc uptake system protein ZnuA n=1 Tax=Wolbachia pipientis TaxID=955 RepID=A0A1E7QKL8_WOLPI|nr:zinc ABC transporter substrate-binding protein [Wolbachia pipientis]OEY86993.1 ABC transporter substrate-binding protein [Wolbachia pipientis]
MKHWLFFSLLVLCYNTAFSDNLKVVATIKPIHSLVSSVTEGILEPCLVDCGATSVHDYILKPSSVSKLESSNIIFYVDDNLETFIKSFGKNRTLVKLSEAVKLLPARPQLLSQNIINEEDLHIWLSPDNAKIMINYISAKLSEIDKGNSARYNYNAMKATLKIDQEIKKIAKELDNLKDKKYIVTHDAYQYFEKYFSLSDPSAILSIEEDSYMGVRSLIKLKRIIKEENIKCVFSNSLENPKIFSNDPNIKIVILDPIGLDIEPGKDAYITIINNIAQNFKSCFIAP